MKFRTVLTVTVVLICAANALSQTSGPPETVRAFYRFSNARSPVFDRRHIESRKRWYSPALYRLFQEELRKQTDFLKQHPDEKPFFGDGLDFRPLHEFCQANGKSYPRSQSLSRTEVVGKSAYVEVKFAYPKACTEEPIYYRVQLKKLNGKWLIDDWTYASGVTLTREMKENKY
jgi:hypothetical protein